VSTLTGGAGQQSFSPPSAVPGWTPQQVPGYTAGGYGTDSFAQQPPAVSNLNANSSPHLDPLEREPKDKITQKGLYRQGVTAHGRIRGTAQRTETLSKG
jgi:hypothetical protein